MLFHKIFLMVILILSLGNFNNFAQENDADSTNIIEVEKENVFDVYFINGYSIGYGLYSDKKYEMRILLDLSNSYSSIDKEWTTKRTTDDIVSYSEKDPTNSSNSDHTLNLTAHFI